MANILRDYVEKKIILIAIKEIYAQLFYWTLLTKQT